jgi:hypothetical protein
MMMMRHFMRIVEAAVTDRMREQIFYHGTSDEANGQSILQNGIVPGNTSHARGHTTPVAGRSYLTTNLRYGVIYCIGGNMLGSDGEYLINKVGRHGRPSRYGWLFVVRGDRLIDDIQPDEDSVGEAAHYAEMILNGKEDDWRYHQHDPLFQGLLKADRQWLRYFYHNAKSSMTPKQWQDATFGLISGQASGGKRFLKRMNDTDKLNLINAGAHVAYRGPVVPDEAWRFDKMNTAELEPDGENFWELAEKVR